MHRRTFAALTTVAGTAGLLGLVATATGSGAQAEPIAEFFDYTGEDQAYEVPAGVSCITTTVLGADGGDGAEFETEDMLDQVGTAALEPGGAGGAGFTVTANLAVTPGEQLVLRVGEAGGDATVGEGEGGGDPGEGGDGAGPGGDGGTGEGSEGGGGGGGSAVLRGTTPLVVAGGGGGGGAAGPNGVGGDAGAGGAAGQAGEDGVPANDEEDDETEAGGGGGGTATAPGAGGVATYEDNALNTGQEPGDAGSGQAGGDGGSSGDGGGGGGGGWFGGGGGAAGYGTSGAGGGGGSSYATGTNPMFALVVDDIDDGQVLITYIPGDNRPCTASAPPAALPVTAAPRFTG